MSKIKLLFIGICNYLGNQSQTYTASSGQLTNVLPWAFKYSIQVGQIDFMYTYQSRSM